MSTLILTVFVIYTILILVIAHLTSRKSTNDTFFTGNRKSPWFVVAYGMIGASLSCRCLATFTPVNSRILA